MCVWRRRVAPQPPSPRLARRRPRVLAGRSRPAPIWGRRRAFAVFAAGARRFAGVLPRDDGDDLLRKGTLSFNPLANIRPSAFFSLASFNPFPFWVLPHGDGDDLLWKGTF